MNNFNPVELLIKKRDGYSLAPEEISCFVNAYLKGEIADYQMSAFFNGLFSARSG